MYFSFKWYYPLPPSPPKKRHWIWEFFMFSETSYWCWSLQSSLFATTFLLRHYEGNSILVQWPHACIILLILLLAVIIFIIHVCKASCCVWVCCLPLKKAIPKSKTIERDYDFVPNLKFIVNCKRLWVLYYLIQD